MSHIAKGDLVVADDGLVLVVADVQYVRKDGSPFPLGGIVLGNENDEGRAFRARYHDAVRKAGQR